ncbi:class II aldolase/adducin family protein [Dactylosporangium sp. NPDC051485]|uniref:class II aldolase/adducin family protein n=1 Tax=Dactylosporangium sp. NPDC051485 TaxID=3154846 RepID=UPI003446FAC1
MVRQLALLERDGLAVAGAGNVSARLDSGRTLITRSGLRFGTASAADLCVVDEDGVLTGGVPDQELRAGARPSSETQLHLGVYRVTGARAVVHTHGAFCTAVSTVVETLPPVHYSVHRLGGPVGVVGYHTFGSPELADAVATGFAGGARAVLMRNHGAVVTGDSVEQAAEFAQLLEWLCEVYWRACALGTPALLTPEQLAAAADQSGRIAYMAER